MRTARLEQVGRALSQRSWPLWDGETVRHELWWRISDLGSELQAALSVEWVDGRHQRLLVAFNRSQMTKRISIDTAARIVAGKLRRALGRAVGQRRLVRTWADKIDEMVYQRLVAEAWHG